MCGSFFHVYFVVLVCVCVQFLKGLCWGGCSISGSCGCSIFVIISNIDCTVIWMNKHTSITKQTIISSPKCTNILDSEVKTKEKNKTKLTGKLCKDGRICNCCWYNGANGYILPLILAYDVVFVVQSIAHGSRISL